MSPSPGLIPLKTRLFLDHRMKHPFDLGTAWLFAMQSPAQDLSSVHAFDVGSAQTTTLPRQRPDPKT
ncbi:MAG: hypothetical protein CK538_03145 [Opitutia bacterium]|nr:MAG: hypothetical protein CK538_03145 [Opitutae bacterium]